MSQAWVCNLTNVDTATGDLTALFPEWYPANSGSLTPGTLRRRQWEGKIMELFINPKDATGGRLEIWDVAGEYQGASNNTDTGNTITNAYLLAKVAQKRAKRLAVIEFKGDYGTTSKSILVPKQFVFGLCARFIDEADAAGSKLVELVISIDGGATSFQFGG